MSALLRSAKGAITYSDEKRNAIVKNPVGSMPQWTKGISASSQSVDPGATVTISVKFNSTDWEEEIAHYFYYGIQNSHATESITFPQGPLYHFEEMDIIINDGEQRLNLKLPAIKELMGDDLKNQGLNIYEHGYFWREEFDTNNGITVGPLSTKYFYYPLDSFISFAGTSFRGEIKQLKFELRVLSEQSTAANATRYAISSSNVNLWTMANINVINLVYIRNYLLVRNPNLFVQLFGSLPASIPMRHINWKVEERVLYSGSWLTGQTWTGKLSDIYKGNKIQFINFFVTPNVTTFNNVEGPKEYSGSNYLGYKYRELNNGGNEKELDLTDKRKCKDFELQQYKLNYGQGKQLPLTIFNNSADLMTKHFLRMTRLDFDYLQEESQHEVERLFSTNQNDFEVTIVANADVGASCSLRATFVMSETLEYIREKGETFGQFRLVQ